MGRNTSGSLRYIEMGELMVEQQRWEARCTNDTSVEGAPRSLHDMQEKHRRLKRMADYQSHDYDPPDTQLDELVLRARYLLPTIVVVSTLHRRHLVKYVGCKYHDRPCVANSTL